MNRTFWNVLIDLAAASLFLAMLATGYILRFPLPPGTNKTATLWELTRHEWGAIHAWFSLALVGVIIVHLALHWQWIVSVIGKRLRLTSKAHPGLLRSGLIVASLLGLALALFAWEAQDSVKAITEVVPGVCPPEDLPESNAAHQPIQPENGEPQFALWADVQAILTTKCLSCHGPNRQFGDFRVDQRDDFFRDDVPLVVPGKSAESPLIGIVSGRRRDMKSAERHKLSEQELTQLKAWIDAGAAWPAKPGSEK
jgi:mono/diheme cytochrome c family protein